ncbi:unnamed protein product [Durusdinium trenchii]|uniref:Uncharacterized protein n=1 Tax=Durusdinium trenchii TaxID=1381693 RepID=A0ABP0JGK9_9DINO
MHTSGSGTGSGYWSSDAWDPDSRVYTGADIFHTHRLAVQSDEAPPAEPSEPRTEAEPKMRRGDSASYWGAMDGLDEVRSMDLGIGNISLARSPPAKKVSFDGPQQAASQAPQHAHPQLQHQGSSEYWTSGNWDFDSRAQRPVKPEKVEKIDVDVLDTPSTQSGGGRSLPRKDSNAYWDAEQWDPDERVYVGAEAGQTNHLTAVIQSDDKLIRAWAGGLSCPGSFSGPVDILKALEWKGAETPELQDLYDVTAESVGFGSFGIVRKATHRETDTHCVVKSLKKSQSGSSYKSQVDGGLYDELMSMSVHSPYAGIVKYMDLLESADHYYVVMEDLQGPELLEQMERLFPVTEAHCQGVMREVLMSLAHIHDKVKVCHRDIKLDNFRYRSVEPGSPLVLLDFGFLARLDKPWDGKKCGTRMYMAPEVIADAVEQPYLAAIDMWSVGVILYTLFTGDCPVQPEEMQTLGTRSHEAQELLAKALQAERLNSISSEEIWLHRQWCPSFLPLLASHVYPRLEIFFASELPHNSCKRFEAPLAVTFAARHAVPPTGCSFSCTSSQGFLSEGGNEKHEGGAWAADLEWPVVWIVKALLLLVLSVAMPEVTGGGILCSDHCFERAMPARLDQMLSGAAAFMAPPVNLGAPGGAGPVSDLSAWQPPTTPMDFSKLGALSSQDFPVPRDMVEYLMTPEHRQILLEETGCDVDWAPDEAKVILKGSAEQIRKAERLLQRVLMHSNWGRSEVKVRRLLKPPIIESAVCRLSPMNTLPPGQKTLSQTQPILSIGKDKANDVVIPAQIVSRQHCVLELDVERGAVYVIDCSTNGTYLNGLRLPPKSTGKVLLSHGDELLLQDPGNGDQEFGYVVNIQELNVRERAKLQAPRRILTTEESATIGRDFQ